ncbi:unnamed protein product, partial [Owenia fusiformis]
DELCNFCACKDTYEHFFIECRKIKRVWEIIDNTCFLKLKRKIEFKHDIIFGYKDEDKTVERKINLMLMVGKHVISKYKCGLYSYNVECMLEHEMRLRNL